METLNLQPPSIDWLIYRDDTAILTIVLTDDQNNPLDLTDWSFMSQAREYPTDVETLTTLGVEKNENILTIGLDTGAVPLISYFDVQGNNDVTGHVCTILRGQIILEEDVTR